MFFGFRSTQFCAHLDVAKVLNRMSGYDDPSELEVPIAARFPLDDIRADFAQIWDESWSSTTPTNSRSS
jgi:hypothetical protein